MTDENRPDLPPVGDNDFAPPPPPYDDAPPLPVLPLNALDDDKYDDEDDAYLDESDVVADNEVYDELLETFSDESFGAAETAPLDFDIDAALAALGSLDSVMSEQAAVEAAEQERADAERRTEEEYQRWAESYQFPRPGMTRVQAGRPVSFIPAIGLIGVGALMTFGSTLNLPSTPTLLAALVMATIGLALVSYWLSSKRWARGALFLGLSAVGVALMVALPSFISLTLPAVALFMVIGAALMLTGLFSRPASGGLSALGAGVVVASVAALFIF